MTGMTWIGAGSCEGAANLGWLIGCSSGTLIAIVLVITIAHAPRLREHGGTPPQIGRAPHLLRWLPAGSIVLLWLAGLCSTAEEVACYAPW